MTAILTGLVAAILYGVGAAIQQHQAAQAPGTSAGRPRLLVHLARQPLWVAGGAAQLVGFILHAVALRFGALAIVQMLVATSLIVSVVTVRFWTGQKLSPSAWGAAATVVVGVAAFLVLTTPPSHLPRHSHPPHHQVLAAAVTLVIVTMAVTAAGLRASGPQRAGLLATGAGLIDTVMAVATTTFTHVVTQGLAAIVASWSTYTLIVFGLSSLLITQSAYQAGHPLITLPVLSAVTPAASVAVGFGLLGETFRLGTADIAGAALAVVGTSIGLAVLASSASRGATLATGDAGPAARGDRSP
ncbi:MAG TPA: DMT family transporter [Trebonia sp.]|nr:DMT family transporter [Trebonia sp.]